MSPNPPPSAARDEALRARSSEEMRQRVVVDAFHLPASPGAAAPEPVEFASFDDGERQVVLRAPAATPERIAAVLEELAAARREVLARRTAAEIVEVLARVGECWADPASRWRREAEDVLPTVTGYARPMIALGLDWVASILRREEMTALLERELGDAAALDTFRPRRGASGEARAYGAPVVTHIFSGNVPGIPAHSLMCAFLVKSASLGKPAAAEPVFPALFARSIAAVDPELGRCLAVLPWKGGDESIEDVALRTDAVIVYGGQAALESVKRRVGPDTRFLGYGHKLSFAVVGREALSPDRIREAARRAAVDVSTFDQQGCLSPHVIYVEDGGAGSPADFARNLAEEMDAFHARVPRGRLTAPESAAINQLRGAYEFRAFEEPAIELFASRGGTEWTVVLDPDPAFEPSCLNRTVRVKPVPDVASVAEQVRPVRRFLQTVGVDLEPGRLRSLADQLGALGATRICPLGRMATPTLEWSHDGRANLLDLVRWTDIEQG